MRKKCAYCGDDEKKLSNEHIFPSWLYQMSLNDDTNLFQGKVISSELKIGDVCVRCNNEPLSQLDDYVKGLYEKYFQNLLIKGQKIEFIYDYNKLTRWLLKVIYNSARAYKSYDTEVLKEFTQYIICGIQPPRSIIIIIETIIPTNYDEIILKPEFQRISVLNKDMLPKEINSIFSVTRLISLNSYCFYIFIPKENNKLSRQMLRNYYKKLESFLPESNILKSNSTFINIEASKVDVLTSGMGHFDRILKFLKG